ncbi:MAG: hypothetical protein COZ18_03275 [Flexibacter sp. CG_4_10_14_3_um_filter_32_15]|nr:MAG: hypothetical protein COZ18_03275 [Flexibacter sp. CG_4_10_14_3_um_filter_32_15]
MNDFWKKNHSVSKQEFILHKQFESVISYHFPVEASGRLIGKELDNAFFLGYTAGFSYNSINEIITGFALIPERVSYDISIIKNSYIVPHLGLDTGINLKNSD